MSAAPDAVRQNKSPGKPGPSISRATVKNQRE